MNVLVIDDEWLVRWSLTEALSVHGHTVVSAGDGPSALTAMAERMPHPDVVLLDYRLPGANGIALVPDIRALSPGSRVILVTAYGTPEIAGRALEAGVSRIVDKPIDIEDVEDLLAP